MSKNKYSDWKAPDGAGWYQVSGTINEAAAGNLTAAVLNWLEKNGRPGGVFVIYLNSVGGNVLDALAMRATIGILRRQGHTCVVVILGRSSSCANLVAQAGDQVFMDENAWLMIHHVTSAASGQSQEIQVEAAITERLDAQSLALSATPQMPPAELTQRLDTARTLWLSAEEAWRQGLLNGILKEPAIVRRRP